MKNLLCLSAFIFVAFVIFSLPQANAQEYTYIVCDGPADNPCANITDFDQPGVVICGPLYDPCGAFNSGGQYVGSSRAFRTTNCGTIDNPCSSSRGTRVVTSQSAPVSNSLPSTPRVSNSMPTSPSSQTCFQNAYPRVYSTGESVRAKASPSQARTALPIVFSGFLTGMVGMSLPRKPKNLYGEKSP